MAKDSGGHGSNKRSEGTGTGAGGRATGDWADRHNYPNKYPNALGKHTHAELEKMADTETDSGKLSAVYKEMDRRRDQIRGSVQSATRGGDTASRALKAAQGKRAPSIASSLKWRNAQAKASKPRDT